jgi:NAD(P)-dependent dehydrogenase (short-subunit alcohol dehydrogenase family)
MHIKNAAVLVTGANRGLGRAFVNAILEAGAAKTYAAARDPSTITRQGVVPIQLDITSETDIAAAQCTDVTVLINNAGIARGRAFTEAGSAAAARAELETNFFGPLNLSLAFAPILKANGGGAIVNVLSVTSWLNFRSAATYSASKSAAWSFTNGLRTELKSQGTQVVGVHVGLMDTDMARGFDVPKADPLDVARQTLVAIAEGKDEVLADDLSRQVKQGLSAGAYLAQVD